MEDNSSWSWIPSLDPLMEKDTQIIFIISKE